MLKTIDGDYHIEKMSHNRRGRLVELEERSNWRQQVRGEGKGVNYIAEKTMGGQEKGITKYVQWQRNWKVRNLIT